MGNEDKKLSEMLDNTLMRAKSHEAARNALAQLFPKAEKVLRTYVPHNREDRNERKRQHRISEKDSVPTYFRLDPHPASWGRSEIDSILNSDPFEALTKVEERISKAPSGERSRLRRLFLDALNGAFDVGRPFTSPWLRALVQFSPVYVEARDEVRNFLHGFDNADRLRWIVVNALRPMLPESRASLLLAAIPHATDISILCDVVRTIAGDQHPEGATSRQETPGFGELTNKVRDEQLARVRQIAETGQFWSQVLPAHILWFWWGCDLQDEVQKFTKATMKTDVGLRSLLKTTISVVQSSEGDYETVNSSWLKVVDLNELDQRAATLESTDNKSDQELVTRFRSALEKGRNRPF